MHVVLAVMEPLSTEPQPTWWSGYVPWLALGVFVVTSALTAAFLPTVLRGGLSKVSVTKAMVQGPLAAGTADVGSAAAAASGTPASGTPGDGAADDPSGPVGTVPTWEALDLDMFNQDDARQPD
jgi:hypothetical protein